MTMAGTKGWSIIELVKRSKTLEIVYESSNFTGISSMEHVVRTRASFRAKRGTEVHNNFISIEHISLSLVLDCRV